VEERWGGAFRIAAASAEALTYSLLIFKASAGRSGGGMWGPAAERSRL